MQVILKEDVPHLGHSGELVSVKPGFGRNYLIPRGLAVAATDKNVARMDHEKRVIAAKTAKELKDAQAFGSRLEGTTVNIARQSGEGDKLFGSVTARDVGEALSAAGYPVDHRKIELPEPIRALGLHEITVRLSREVASKIKVWVVKKQ
jgi:large subunit ribosomal protein L9